jgi:addiction module HigA family antidote
MPLTLAPVSPAEILQREFLQPLGVTPTRLQEALRLTPRAVEGLLSGQQRITADLALRLGKGFRTSPEFWLNLQTQYDLETRKADTTQQFVLQEVVPLTPEWKEPTGE